MTAYVMQNVSNVMFWIIIVMAIIPLVGFIACSLLSIICALLAAACSIGAKTKPITNKLHSQTNITPINITHSSSCWPHSHFDENKEQ
jgi:hypothetical protein